MIQTVDSVGLATRLDRLAGELGMERVPVLLQVNVDLDAAKSGFRPDDLARGRRRARTAWVGSTSAVS